MQQGGEFVGREAVVKTSQGDFYAEGTIIGAYSTPVFCIERADGTRLWWRQDLCEVVGDLTPALSTGGEGGGR
jgi:hypothetical protein